MLPSCRKFTKRANSAQVLQALSQSTTFTGGITADYASRVDLMQVSLSAAGRESLKRLQLEASADWWEGFRSFDQVRQTLFGRTIGILVIC